MHVWTRNVKSTGHLCDQDAPSRGTYRDEELLDLLHGVSHAQIGLWNGRHHLDEHVELHGQVSVFSLATLPQLLFLILSVKGGKR